MQRIAIVGGAGFVGTNLALEARRRGFDIVVVDSADRLSRLRHSGLADVADCDLLDLAAPGAVLETKADVYVHLAALPQVDYSLFYPESAVVNNIASLTTTLAAARQTGTPVLFTSSIEVYGGNDGAVFREDDPVLALSPYAASKIGCEHIVDSYRVNFGLVATTVRLTNLYGPWQAPDRIIPRIVLQTLLGIPSEAVTGRLRDFLYVEDAVDALLGLLEGGHWGQRLNVAAGHGVALEDVASSILRTVGAGELTTVDAPPRDGRGPSLVASPDRLEAVTGWTPRTAWTEGLQRTVDWYRENQSWWQQFDHIVSADRNDPAFLVDHALPLTAQPVR
ncbi:dTDP-glucose 4,6-dehydratase [Kribbella albertanoniae]|uniref:NAD-dependent epimerase/dehydratase family protein n=1 Tax=Kribbella albertanoniae TaxID=1266829 RepID=UPI001404A72A|nr:NAD-dependent epimerase/dehydratase family protein [Kribbella albertanoniae]